MGNAIRLFVHGSVEVGLMDVKNIIDLIVNNGTAVALLIYFIYKDNKFTSQIEKALVSIDESLKILRATMDKKDD